MTQLLLKIGAAVALLLLVFSLIAAIPPATNQPTLPPEASNTVAYVKANAGAVEYGPRPSPQELELESTKAQAAAQAQPQFMALDRAFAEGVRWGLIAAQRNQDVHDINVLIAIARQLWQQQQPQPK